MCHDEFISDCCVVMVSAGQQPTGCICCVESEYMFVCEYLSQDRDGTSPAEGFHQAYKSQALIDVSQAVCFQASSSCTVDACACVHLLVGEYLTGRRAYIAYCSCGSCAVCWVCA